MSQFQCAVTTYMGHFYEEVCSIIVNATMPSNHHILIHIMSNSPETNSTKRVDEKRGWVAWPVEEIKQKEAKTKIIDTECKL